MTFNIRTAFDIRQAFSRIICRTYDSGLEKWCAEHKDFSLFGFSRYSICAVALDRKKDLGVTPTVWFPAFICREALEPLEMMGFPIRLYDVFGGVDYKCPSALLDGVCKGVDIIVYVHYFGSTDCSGLPEFAEFTKRNDLLLVEDAAHCPAPEGWVARYGDYTYFSLYKHYPLREGSLLLSRNSMISTTAEELSNLFNEMNLRERVTDGIFNDITWWIREICRIFCGSFWKKSGLRSGNYFLLPAELKLLSPIRVSALSKRLILGIDPASSDPEKRIRVREAWVFAVRSVLSNLNGLDVDQIVQLSNNRYMLPIMVKSQADGCDVVTLLRKCGFPLLQWPDLPLECLSPIQQKRAIALYYLPINPSISVKEIFKLVGRTFQKVPVQYSVMLPYMSSKRIIPFVQTEAYLGSRKKSSEQISVWQSEGSFCRARVRFLYFFEILIANFGPIWDKEITVDFARKALSQITKPTGYFFPRISVIAPFLSANPLTEFLLFQAGFAKVKRVAPWSSSKVVLKDRSFEQIQSDFSSKWRNQLRVSQRSGISVRKTTVADEIRLIYQLSSDFLKSIGVAPISEKIIDNLLKSDESQNYLDGTDAAIIGWIAEKENQMVSAIILGVTAFEATYLIGWSSETGRKFYSNQNLLYNALEDCRRTGLEVFDTGGIDEKKSPGVASFKKGMGGQPYQLVGTYVKVPFFLKPLILPFVEK